jgi:hypothetical protein
MITICLFKIVYMLGELFSTTFKLKLKTTKNYKMASLVIRNRYPIRSGNRKPYERTLQPPKCVTGVCLPTSVIVKCLHCQHHYCPTCLKDHHFVMPEECLTCERTFHCCDPQHYICFCNELVCVGQKCPDCMII